MSTNNDLISRQAAIALAYFHGEPSTWDNPMPDGVDAVDVSDLEALPLCSPRTEADTSEIKIRNIGVHDTGLFLYG